MNAQQQIILALLRDQPADDLRRLDRLTEAEWQPVIRLAEAEGLGPLLWNRTARHQVRTPQTVRAQLHQLLLDNTARNLRLLQHFELLARALQGRQVSFLALKGVYLCSNIYENPGERSIWDIDVVVPPAELGRAIEAIERAGYRPTRPYDLELELRRYHHVPVYRMPGAPPLELHWTLLNPRFQRGLDWQGLWDRSMEARIGASSVRVPGVEDLLIYLCAHVAYQHMYIDSISSLYDIKLVLRHFEGHLDWAVISHRAEAWGLLNSLYLTLHLTDALLGPVLPESIRARLRPADFQGSIAEAAVSRLLEGADRSPVLNAVWSRKTPLQRIQGLWERIAVPRSVLAGRYGLPPRSPRVWLYYLVRVWDLFRVYGRSMIELVLGGEMTRQRAARDSQLVAYLDWWP